MTRKECLDAAAKCVLQDRQDQYGRPEDCFQLIAELWGSYLRRCISAHDVAAMMALLKIARFRHNPGHLDNAVDLAGYAACMAETATAWEREGEEDGVHIESHWPDFVEKKKAEGVEESEDLFPSGTPIEVKWGSHWVPARYFYGDGLGFHHVRMQDGGEEIVGVKAIRPVKAEGCEELVVSPFDAPQTREELYSKILESNPATYGRAHKPTGEELAEMAEENAHG